MATRYSLSEYESDPDMPHPSLPNLFDAASFIDTLLTTNNIPYAIMGGFAMICRGSTRSTTDIDIIVNAPPLKIWSVIETQPRMKVPKKRLVSGVIKVFIKIATAGNRHTTEVEVDLVFPTSKGSPRAENLAEHTENMQFDFQGRIYAFKCIDVYYMMRTKLWHCARREMFRDAYDIEYLLVHCTDQVARIAESLDEEDKESFMNHDAVQTKSIDTRRKYREILHIKAIE